MFATFLKSANLDMISVSYREIGSALQDLAEDRFQVTVTGLTAILPQVQAAEHRPDI
jgi:tripartite-type tricarboxylate transporter receptor subunit TctC